jgi:hypothetical protein
MAVPTAQLETWGKQGPTAQFTYTYETIKAVLEDGNAPYANQSKSIFLQGSYCNDTNVYGDSDVDVVICFNSIFYSDLTNLSNEDKAAFEANRSSAQHTVHDFKQQVINWLVNKYGAAVMPRSKAVYIHGSGARRNADVLITADLRRWYTYKNPFNNTYAEGICFFNSSGQRIDNFPKQHSANCTTKHQNTNRWFKQTVRTFKNARTKLIADYKIEDGLAPSYFIEGLLYNVPADRFGGGDSANFNDVLAWLLAAERSKFVCANEMFYLCHPAALETWRAEKCDRFLNALSNLSNTWAR